MHCASGFLEVEELRPKMTAFNGQLTPKREALLQRKEKFACQRPAVSTGVPQNAALAELFTKLQMLGPCTGADVLISNCVIKFIHTYMGN